MGAMVVTWQAPDGATLDVCRACEARLKKDRWPRNRSAEFCTVSHGLHHADDCASCLDWQVVATVSSPTSGATWRAVIQTEADARVGGGQLGRRADEGGAHSHRWLAMVEAEERVARLAEGRPVRRIGYSESEDGSDGVKMRALLGRVA